MASCLPITFRVSHNQQNTLVLLCRLDEKHIIKQENEQAARMDKSWWCYWISFNKVRWRSHKKFFRAHPNHWVRFEGVFVALSVITKDLGIRSLEQLKSNNNFVWFWQAQSVWAHGEWSSPRLNEHWKWCWQMLMEDYEENRGNELEEKSLLPPTSTNEFLTQFIIELEFKSHI